MKEIISDYELRLDYDRETDDASQIFYSLSGIISSFNQIDKLVGNTLSQNVECHQRLISIKEGSIRSRILSKIILFGENTLKDPDTETAKKYYQDSKKLIVKSINDITDNAPKYIDGVKSELDGISKRYGIQGFYSSKPIEKMSLAESINSLTESANNLTESESLLYCFDEEEIDIPKGKIISLQDVKADLVEDVHTYEKKAILKIKKPDYLGNSKWDLKIEGKSYDVEITHQEWLQQFRAKKFLLGPGDSIRAEIKITDKYGKNRELISTTVEAFNIFEIIEGKCEDQELF